MPKLGGTTLFCTWPYSLQLSNGASSRLSKVSRDGLIKKLLGPLEFNDAISRPHAMGNNGRPAMSKLGLIGKIFGPQELDNVAEVLRSAAKDPHEAQAEINGVSEKMPPP